MRSGESKVVTWGDNDDGKLAAINSSCRAVWRSSPSTLRPLHRHNVRRMYVSFTQISHLFNLKIVVEHAGTPQVARNAVPQLEDQGFEPEDPTLDLKQEPDSVLTSVNSYFIYQR